MYTVEFRPIKSLILIQKGLFSMTIIKIVQVSMAVHMQASVDVLKYSSENFKTFGKLA